jgi:hypothetical protein
LTPRGLVHPNAVQGVLDTTGGAGVLRLHTDGADAFLQAAGFVDDQHRAGVAAVFGDVVTQVVADLVGVPGLLCAAGVRAVRNVVAGVFGDRPAVLVRQVGEQARAAVFVLVSGIRRG